ncbi:MAG: GIN domain-containing protein, partial [Neoaquamicrobium sediminum]
TELRGLTAKSVQLEIRGSGSVSANGTADAVDVNISGSGDAALRKLTAKSVRVNIQGSGDASLTAQVDADVFVSGSGDVELSGGPVMRRSEAAAASGRCPEQWQTAGDACQRHPCRPASLRTSPMLSDAPG